MSALDQQTKKLAAIAYGEASVSNIDEELAAIAFAVVNRCKAWGGKTIDELLTADPNYTYAIQGKNKRFNNFMALTTLVQIHQDKGKSLAWAAAERALARDGDDPSNGAYWWDGLDLKTNYGRHPKVLDGFHYGAPSHNIFDVSAHAVETTIYWKVKNKKTGQEVSSKVRGKYSYIWISTAAIGKTIFWKHDPEFLRVSACKEYR